ncbi:MAG TPA: hypothetical protein P5519_09985 [Spirochaetia bacterium]|nr:hypothetical protein [Spirochaetia bacterium]
MLITKTNPVGIDALIQQLQTKLHTELCTAWALTDCENDQQNKYYCYGRAYRNATANGFIAEVYTSNGEYKEVYWDDKLYAVSFFGIAAQTDRTIGSKTDVHLVYFVNTKKLKPDVTHRADEEVRLDVLNIIGKSSFGFVVDSVELWLQNVLQEYPGSIRDERLKYVDMYPVHCFRLNMTINYNPNYCSSLKFK